MDPSAAPSPDNAARIRIGLTYLWRHGRMPDLERPTRFTEMVQCRKLFDHDPRMPALADKVAVKEVVADRLGRDWVIPTLWSGTTMPDDDGSRVPVVLKSRHGCNQTIVVRGARPDRQAMRRATERWMARRYGRWLDEWLYAHIPRGLLIEPFVGEGTALPTDYKVYVFHGQATHVQVHLDRGGDHRWIIHDRDWCPVARWARVIPRPSALAAILAAAEEMARGFDFVRVDFYQPSDHPLFGEMSFYPGSGLDPFDPPELDLEMGRLWAASRRPSAAPVGGLPGSALAT